MMQAVQEIYRNENLFSFGLHLPFRYWHHVTTRLLEERSTVFKVAAYALYSLPYIFTGTLLAIAMVIRAPQHFLSGNPYKDCYFVEKVKDHFSLGGLYSGDRMSLQQWQAYFSEYNSQITLAMQKEYLQGFLQASISNTEIVPSLLEYLAKNLGWDVTSRRFGLDDKEGENLLHYTVGYCHFLSPQVGKAVVAKLIELGVDPNEQDDAFNKPPLSCTIHVISQTTDIHVAYVEALIEGGARPNGVGENGWTVLHSLVLQPIGYNLLESDIPDDDDLGDAMATVQREKEIVPLILALRRGGARSDIGRSRDNKTAMQMALESGLTIVKEALEQELEIELDGAIRQE